MDVCTSFYLVWFPIFNLLAHIELICDIKYMRLTDIKGPYGPEGVSRSNR